MEAPVILLELTIISTDPQKRPYIAVTISPIFLKKGTSLFPPINMSFLFSCFPKSFNFSIFLLVFGRFLKNLSITPALPQSWKTTFWFLSFQHHVFPFTWTEYTTLWNTFETLISPQETTPPPPNFVWSMAVALLFLLVEPQYSHLFSYLTTVCEHVVQWQQVPRFPEFKTCTCKHKRPKWVPFLCCQESLLKSCERIRLAIYKYNAQRTHFAPCFTAVWGSSATISCTGRRGWGRGVPALLSLPQRGAGTLLPRN